MAMELIRYIGYHFFLGIRWFALRFIGIKCFAMTHVNISSFDLLYISIG